MYETLRTIPDCKPLQSRLKYMDGPEHCNYVQAAHGDNKYGFIDRRSWYGRYQLQAAVWLCIFGHNGGLFEASLF